MADETKKVDSVLVPFNYPPNKGKTPERHLALQAEFAPILGCTHIATRFTQDVNVHHITPFPVPPGEPPAVADYDWTDRGDGVKYGTKKADA